jgi:aspartate 1-decarboxylase
MLKSYCHTKIHRATITGVNINYEGSITIDKKLLEAAGIDEYEEVHVLDINNGSRFITYAIPGKENSGIIQVNGAAARLCIQGDLVIILSYSLREPSTMKDFKQNVVYVDHSNKIVSPPEIKH